MVVIILIINNMALRWYIRIVKRKKCVPTLWVARELWDIFLNLLGIHWAMPKSFKKGISELVWEEDTKCILFRVSFCGFWRGRKIRDILMEYRFLPIITSTCLLTLAFCCSCKYVNSLDDFNWTVFPILLNQWPTACTYFVTCLLYS